MSIVLRVKAKTLNVSKLLTGSLYMMMSHIQCLFLAGCSQKIKPCSGQVFLLGFFACVLEIKLTDALLFSISLMSWAKSRYPQYVSLSDFPWRCCLQCRGPFSFHFLACVWDKEHVCESITKMLQKGTKTWEAFGWSPFSHVSWC